MNKYENGKIYKIVNISNDKVYVGSTCKSLKSRFIKHKSLSKTKPNWLLYTEFNEIGIHNFKIELIELFPCNEKWQLLQRESYYIGQLNPVLNSRESYTGLTKQEYEKEYRNDNKDTIKEYMKEYQQTNKDKLFEWKTTKKDCECGGTYTLCNKSQHIKTRKHANYIESLNME